MTKDGAKSRLTRGKEEDIAKGEISKTPLLNWDRKEEISKSRSKVGIKARFTDYQGKADNRPKVQWRIELRQDLQVAKKRIRLRAR
jgi:hypothetical protein